MPSRPHGHLAHQFGLILVSLALLAVRARAQSARTDTPTPLGPVLATTTMGNTIYLAGNFNRVGLPKGGAAVFDGVSGASLTAPLGVDGVVNVAAPDGSGGFYFGGTFTHVLGQSRNHLAHLLADGSLADWDPGTGISVTALAAAS